MFTPISGIIVARASRDLIKSALPWAPILPEPDPSQRLASRRQSAAARLRVFVSTTNRLADRLDPNYT